MIELAGETPAALFDVRGCPAGELSVGLNDVSRLAPGAYFVRGADDATAQKILLGN